MAYDEQPQQKSRLLDPVIHEASTTQSYSHGLASSEIETFKREGFLVKRGLVSDAQSMDRLIDYVWENVPNGAMDRDDPATWTDLPHKRWPEGANQQIGLLSRGNWKMRSHRAIGTEDFLLDTTARHPNVLKVVSQLIGDPVRSPARVRGIYVVLPKPPDVEGRLGPHADHAAAQLSAMVLLGETPPHCGGFTIWPRSHVMLHEYWESNYSAFVAEDRKEAFARAQHEVLSTIHPLEFTGQAGDVVFWHPRLLHSAGVNYSAQSEQSRIRYVVPCDFQHDHLTYYDDDELGPGESEQWWVCTRHFREDQPPSLATIWDDWEI